MSKTTYGFYHRGTFRNLKPEWVKTAAMCEKAYNSEEDPFLISDEEMRDIVDELKFVAKDWIYFNAQEHNLVIEIKASGRNSKNIGLERCREIFQKMKEKQELENTMLQKVQQMEINGYTIILCPSLNSYQRILEANHRKFAQKRLEIRHHGKLSDIKESLAKMFVQKVDGKFVNYINVESEKENEGTENDIINAGEKLPEDSVVVDGSEGVVKTEVDTIEKPQTRKTFDTAKESCISMFDSISVMYGTNFTHGIIVSRK